MDLDFRDCLLSFDAPLPIFNFQFIISIWFIIHFSTSILRFTSFFQSETSLDIIH